MECQLLQAFHKAHGSDEAGKVMKIYDRLAQAKRKFFGAQTKE